MRQPASRSETDKNNVQPFPNDRLGDAELLSALARGDRSALGILWDRHAAAVRGLLRSNLGTDPVVDDLLQEVFLALVNSASRVRCPDALRAYLFGIALRQVAMEIRRRKRKRWLLFLPANEVPEPKVPQQFAASPAVEALRRVLASVDERQQQAFWLRFVEELSPAEVGAALGVSESTAKREIARGRDRVLKLARLEPALAGHLASLEGTNP